MPPNTPSWVLFTFFKLYKLYKIAQRITHSGQITTVGTIFLRVGEISQHRSFYFWNYDGLRVFDQKSRNKKIQPCALFIKISVDICQLKINSLNEILLKLMTGTLERRQRHVSYIFLLFPLLTLSKQIMDGIWR